MAPIESTRPFHELTISARPGGVEVRHYDAPGAECGVVWVGGVGGFWDGPAGDLYPHLCDALRREGIGSLRINVRHPTDLDACVADTLSGIAFLRDRGIARLALVGHAFAGAVAIRAAVYSTLPETVVALAAQSQGAELVSRLPIHCSLFLLHGTADEVVHVSNSEYLAALAHPPKRLLLLEGARHRLDEAAPTVHREVGAWLRDHLRPSQQLTLPEAG
jgi:alpha/beta superfamily hydrolase